MAALSLICYACQRNAVEVSGVVQECECGCRKMVAAVPIPSTKLADREACQRIAMNWQERARRAEALAGRLAAGFEASNGGGFLEDVEAGQEALEAWLQHRADLDTLEGK